MPSCRSFRKLDQHSSRHRFTMRGRQLSANLRKLLEAKTSDSCSTRQQSSFIIEFRRWLVEFWNSIIKRLKGVFSDPRNLHNSRSLTSRITNMDPDRENDFWRKGGLSHNGEKKLSTRAKRRNNIGNNRIQNREDYQQSNNRRYSRDRTLPISPVSYETRRWPINRRRSNRGIVNFTATETTDEEYCALYKKPSRNRNSEKSNDKLSNYKFSNSSGDYIVEPIEVILSRYHTRKSSKSTLNRNLESSAEETEVSGERKSKSVPKESKSVTDHDKVSVESAEDGKWIETTCFGSVWYSKSELNMATKRKNESRTRNQVSRIPRLRHSPRKRSSRTSLKKNDPRPSSLRQ